MVSFVRRYKWGENPDGVGTPWEEWYDVTKLLSMFEIEETECVRNHMGAEESV